MFSYTFMFYVYSFIGLHHTDTLTKLFTEIFANTSLDRGGHSSKGFAIAQALARRTSACALLQGVRKGVRKGGREGGHEVVRKWCSYMITSVQPHNKSINQ